MSDLKCFVYVQAHYDNPQPNSKKKKLAEGRYHKKEIAEKIRLPSKNQNCFQSAQLFASPRKEGHNDDGEPETHYGGFYFDFDGRIDEHEGCVDHAVEQAAGDVAKVIEHFRALDVQESSMRLWFSGSKGFHLIIDPRLFDIKPSRHNTYVMKTGANILRSRHDLHTLDMGVYTVDRKLRLPNSIHQSSGLWKVEIYHSDLHKGYAHIADQARQSGDEEPLYGVDEYRSVGPEELAVQEWGAFRKIYEDELNMQKLRPRRKIKTTSAWPACVQDIMTNGLKKPGSRNRATMTLAAYFKDTGVPQADCSDLLLGWCEALPDPENKKRERLANTVAVIRSQYTNDSTCFSCAYIRSLSSAEDKVACTEKEGCATIHNDPDTQIPAEIPRVPLSAASQSVFVGKRVSIPVMVTGKNDAPYAYPKKARIDCTPNPESQICQSCSILTEGSPKEVDLDMRNQTLIDLINVHSSRRNAVTKRHAGVPARCAQSRVTVLDWGNIEEVQLQPNILVSGVVDSRKGENESSGDPIDEGSYCNRIGYYVDHGIEINKKYDIEATVWGHPKDQRVCHIFDNAVPSQDDIDRFKMDQETINMLRIFQPSNGQTVSDKFHEIHDDFEKNIHMIWGRREVAIALDICYHAVLNFRFQTVFERKGYVELLVIGDSGNGKTKLVERMMQHYQLGEITGVEGGKRTGLIWANHNIAGRFMLVWGKIPQNDRRLICLDEFSGMPDTEVSTMTRLRTEGIAESQGINTAMTNARTRMIFLTNPRNGRTLSAFNYGVEAVNQLFKEHQDVRRIDLAVCVQSGDVPLEMINKRHVPDMSTHNYTTGICKLLVLWAWSRTADQVHFTPEAEELILEKAIATGRKYRCDIVLVEPSDQRIKLARIATSVAARMFSTQDGENLIVKAEHVEFADRFVNACYDHKAMGYNIYAKSSQERSMMSDEQRSTLKKWWQERDNWQHLRKLFLTGSYFRKNEVEDQTGYNKEQMKDLFRHLSRNLLIASTSAGYRKTPMFTDFLKEFENIDNTDPPF